jgi:spore germination protein KB
MLEKGKISAGDFLIVVIVFTIGSSTFIFLYIQIFSLNPTMTYVENNGKIFGKWIGKITALLFLYYFFHLTSELLREIGDFLPHKYLLKQRSK